MNNICNICGFEFIDGRCGNVFCSPLLYSHGVNFLAEMDAKSIIYNNKAQGELSSNSCLETDDKDNKVEDSSKLKCGFCGEDHQLSSYGFKGPPCFISAVEKRKKEEYETVNHPPHYQSDAKCPVCDQEIECIDITRNMSFNLGNAMKYIWRCEHKGNKKQDLQKAVWYLQDEIKQSINK